MPDNILLIDAYNALHRAANVVFGGKQPHGICQEDNYNHKCNHKLASILKHCRCGSKWDVQKETCYGELYNTIYNFFRMLRPMVEQFEPDKVFFVLEGHPKAKYAIYKDYKANRRMLVKEGTAQQEGIAQAAIDKKEKFHTSVDEVVKILKYFPITVIKANDYEADDTIGALCENMKDENLTVITADKDYIQLLQREYRSCQIFSPIKKEFMVAPTTNFTVLLSLTGDKIDNIPKLLSPKKAEKTANDPELLKQFLSVEENRANFNINMQLVKFAEVPLEEFIFQEGVKDFDNVKILFNNMSFESITNKVSWEKYTETFSRLVH